jgi:hypothetical protein
MVEPELLSSNPTLLTLKDNGFPLFVKKREQRVVFKKKKKTVLS